MKSFLLITLLALSATANAAMTGFVTGDSFSNSNDYDWVAHTEANMLTVAVAGQTLADAEAVYQGHLDDHLALGVDFAIIQGGTNDVKAWFLTVEDMKRSVSSMVGSAAASGIPWYVMNIAPKTTIKGIEDRDEIDEYNHWLSNTYGSRVIDIYTPLATSERLINPLYDADGVHVNQDGARLIAGLVDAKVSAVPVPASAWLFSSALVALVGRKRCA